jgi:hypothetical protein
MAEGYDAADPERGEYPGASRRVDGWWKSCAGAHHRWLRHPRGNSHGGVPPSCRCDSSRCGRLRRRIDRWMRPGPLRQWQRPHGRCRHERTTIGHETTMRPRISLFCESFPSTSCKRFRCKPSIPRKSNARARTTPSSFRQLVICDSPATERKNLNCPSSAEMRSCCAGSAGEVARPADRRDRRPARLGTMKRAWRSSRKQSE